MKKLKYHALSYYIEAEAVKKVGRPYQKEYEKQYEYVLKLDINKDNECLLAFDISFIKHYH